MHLLDKFNVCIMDKFEGVSVECDKIIKIMARTQYMYYDVNISWSVMYVHVQ